MLNKLFTTEGPTSLFQNVLLASLLILLSPYIYLSFFAHPIADDYSAAIMNPGTDYWTKCMTEYFTWLGLYSYTFLYFLNPIIFYDFTIYKIIPVIVILLLVLSIYYFFRAITGRYFSRIGTLNASLLLLLVYLFQMPSLAEGIYWYSGSVEYQAGIIFSILYFGLICDYFNCKYILAKSFHFFLSILFLIAAVGFSEVTMLLLLSFHVLIGVLLFRYEKGISIEWRILIVICLVCSAIVFVAPGNLHRNSLFPDNHNILRSLFYTLLQIVRFGSLWISNLPLLLSSLILMPLAAKYVREISFFRKLEFLTPRVFLFALFWILFVCIFPPYFITNILGQHRTVNVACFFFLLVWLIGIASLANRYNEHTKLFFVTSKLTVIAILLILFSVASTKNGYEVFLDVFYKKAARFDNEIGERYAILKDLKNKGKDVSLLPLNEKPKSLFVLDMSEDSTDWINRSQAKYFGVKSIVCKNEKD